MAIEITRELVDNIIASCVAHGSCKEADFQRGKGVAARTVDALIYFALEQPIHHIEVWWDSARDMIIYMAMDANGAAVSSVCMRDSALPCLTAAMAGFVLYCQESRGIPCEMVSCADGVPMRGGVK